nr:unnamed protein product [Callosobruchus analis]
MTSKSFVKFMADFVKYSNASLNNRDLLILDNHEGHVSMEVIQFARENGVKLSTIPPHTSNKLQPLDFSVNSPFKLRYNAEQLDVNQPSKKRYNIQHTWFYKRCSVAEFELV